MKSSSEPVPIRQSLERLLSSLNAPDVASTVALVERWPEVVGDELAEHIKALAIQGSEMIVGVDDPAWASQLSWLEARLLERIEALVGPGQITKIKVRVEPRSSSSIRH